MYQNRNASKIWEIIPESEIRDYAIAKCKACGYKITVDLRKPLDEFACLGCTITNARLKQLVEKYGLHVEGKTIHSIKEICDALEEVREKYGFPWEI